ncbi:polyprenyl synthetase family protein [Parvularcula dongshanensis]|uniref:Geranylgeranyl pyrophosphate synthase n=1 Tax=Parvularcula dongshanensis TaxID=1173995 RepID=A0A840I5I9_9PROT|nr:polyprenyl synthetase family protein [Parvularcula dongshanensis]MBB4660119.1 geranylgeranyl pyrophosphate synthase [Parvularcula dongshanensis]
MSFTIAEKNIREAGGDGFAQDLASLKMVIEVRLDQLLPRGGEPSLAARYSLLAPAKRLRAVLTVLAARQCGGAEEAALDVACAVEMVHTASLVFDDLPAMDDADLRRGVPTPHKVYGDDVAILAGIGLLNGAFGVVAQAQSLSPTQRVEVVEVLSRAVGWTGLVQGQALDLAHGEGSIDDIHYGKTGALFVAAALAGAACAGAPVSARAPLVTYGRELGLAYQALDDVLDHVASDGLAGKSTRKDADKRTAVMLGSVPSGGLRAAKSRAERHLEAAAEAASAVCDGSPLVALTEHIRAHFEKVGA